MIWPKAEYIRVFDINPMPSKVLHMVLPKIIN